MGQIDEELKERASKQSEDTRYILKKYKEVVHFVKPMPKRVHHMKADERFPFKAPAETSCPCLLSEPSRPPPSAYRLFVTKFRSTTKDLSGPERQAVVKVWKTQSNEVKAAYTDRCRKLHHKYEGLRLEYGP